MTPSEYPKIQYISQGDTLAIQSRNIRLALDAGADWIQIRWKQPKDTAFRDFCTSIKKHCASYQALCLLNDHVDTARAIDADGVHLGLTDMPVSDARALLGTNKIIGGTANTAADILQRMEERCDYIGLGPWRYTTTKKQLSPILGLEGFTEIMTYLQQLDRPAPPIYAIGGIRLEDIPTLQQIGIHGIAVSTLLTEQPRQITSIKSILQ
ncbi:thiamine phosphate synthase [Sphingobacterium sp. lm-10]|uniref:thiamine phosphate synthase n=1 Tax=Sphingobacterium sp. lm-10 TaxID=2944904 RepID=UPI002021C9C3|nr:thiamine phosphate synthase [Sphingobacterium sp. lm-10]MCL7987460.1 thiamine phosphate synthase [Sphingobacterium sp. lm-10]